MKSSIKFNDICSTKTFAVLLSYTKKETILWYSSVIFSKPDENTFFSASSLSFSYIASTVLYSNINRFKIKKLYSTTFKRVTNVRSLDFEVVVDNVHTVQWLEHPQTLHISLKINELSLVYRVFHCSPLCFQHRLMSYYYENICLHDLSSLILPFLGLR